MNKVIRVKMLIDYENNIILLMNEVILVIDLTYYENNIILKGS
jgi:hypothetical protein